MRPSWCEINLDNLIHNYKAIERKVGKGSLIMPVVKADAYGHGAVICAKSLEEIGVRYFAVAIVDEGIQLRNAGITSPILILGHTPIEDIDTLIEYKLIPTVYQREFADALSEKSSEELPIHVKVDTGMGRLGFRGIEESISSIAEISKLQNIKIEGIYSHFSVADIKDKTYSRMQMEKFQKVIDNLEAKGIHIPIKHISNSAAIIDMPYSYYNGVRPGITLYGMYPSEDINKENLSLKTVKTFKTRITNINTIYENESIGYGRNYIASEKRIIATIAVGYGDGYSRLLSNKGQALIRGKRANIIGNVCMDQCMIDITYIPKARLDDEVILYGKDLPIEEIAEKIGTINYEITCMITPRVPKLYYSKNKLVKVDNFLRS